MFEHVVNAIYIVVLVVYGVTIYWAFVTSVIPDLTEPAWSQDTTWRGFWLAPYRMVKGFISHGR